MTTFMAAFTSSIKNILVRIMIVLLPFAIFLVLAELTLRAYLAFNTFYDVEMSRYATTLKQESRNPLVGHEHRANKSMHVMNVDVVINSDGFRDDDYTVERNENRRIIILGDSLTFGWGVEKEDSFEHSLEKMFNKTSPTELINFGAGNYNTTQEVNLLIDKGLRYKPDAVFLFYFINDAETVPKKSEHAWLGHFRLATFFWSRVKALMARRSPSESFSSYYANLYREDQPGWQQTRAAFTLLKQVCADNNIQLKVIILPELHNLVEYTFRNEHAYLADFLASEGIEYLDLAPYFSDQENPMDLWVSLDDAHPNAIAHGLIARYSFPFLSSTGTEE